MLNKFKIELLTIAAVIILSLIATPFVNAYLAHKERYKSSENNPIVYRVDNTNYKVLETLTYNEALYRNNNDWYCLADMWEDELQHVNTISSSNIVQGTPYASSIQKIKKEYINQ